MNKWVVRLLNSCAFVVGFNAIEHVCHVQTDGFSLRRIQFTDEPILHDQDSPPEALNQPYHYLDCGNQSFAFLSDDGKYVLKFFKYVHHSAPDWMTQIPLLNRFKPFRLSRVEKVAWKKERDFQGYEIAYTHLKDQTGLLSLHLHPTSTYPTITLYDKLKIRHRLDLNTTPFVLQKKAAPVYETFSSWIEQGQIEELQIGVKKLIDLCATKIAQGIYDDDVHFYSNFGFVGTEPIQVDPGHFSFQSTPQDLAALTAELKRWFAIHYPPLVTYVEDITVSR